MRVTYAGAPGGRNHTKCKRVVEGSCVDLTERGDASYCPNEETNDSGILGDLSNGGLGIVYAFPHFGDSFGSGRATQPDSSIVGLGVMSRTLPASPVGASVKCADIRAAGSDLQFCDRTRSSCGEALASCYVRQLRSSAYAAAPESDVGSLASSPCSAALGATRTRGLCREVSPLR